MYLFGHSFSFYLACIPDTVYSWCKSYVLQAIICFASFHLFLTWIKVVNPFGVICYFVFAAIIHICWDLWMNYFASIRYYNLFCSWSVWQGSSAQKTLKTCGGHAFILEQQSSLGSASLELIVTPWHIFMSNILQGGSSVLTQFSL